MTEIDTNRRAFVKMMASTTAMAAAVELVPGVAFAGEARQGGIDGGYKWQKTPCRFCGTGCGLLVAVKDGMAVAVKGDPAAFDDAVGAVREVSERPLILMG
ncbi:MAG TPA: twin-arginine translocation signal domain-containing protein, partial [Fibrobacteria bacterium]|nr:twin-arginine translocation signal domain-containing protein [Fibrobacteria bacterium]